MMHDAEAPVPPGDPTNAGVLPRWLARVYAPVLRFPWLALGAVVALSGFLATQARTLQLEADMRNWIPKGHPDVVFDDHVRDVFNVHDHLVIALERRAPGGMYTPAVLQYLADLSRDIETLDGVLQGEVISLATEDNIIGTEDALESEPFMATVPRTPAEVEALRTAVRDNAMYAGYLVSEDEVAAVIFAQVEDGLNQERLCADVEALVAARPPPPETRVLLGGRPILEGAIARLIRAELRVLPLLSNGCMVLMLAVIMRSARGVVLPLLVVLFSNFVAFGGMALIGVKLYSLTTAIIPLLVAMGVADGIHMLTAYNLHVEADPGADRRTVVERMLAEMTTPVVMTSLTTAGGFLALGFAPILPVKFFGIFTAVGVLAAMVFSLVLIPAALLLLPLRVPRRRPPADAWRSRLSPDALLHACARWVGTRPRTVLAGAALVVLAGGVQASRLRIDSSLTDNMPADDRAVRDHVALNEYLQGTSDLELVFDGGAADAVKAPAILEAMDKLQAFAETLPHVGGSLSIAEYLKRMNEVMHAGDPAYFRVPESRDLVAQYLLLYSLSGDPEDFDGVVDYDYRQARVRLHVQSDHSADIVPIARAIEAYVDTTFPPASRPRLAGRAHNLVIMHNLVVSGQLTTLTISVLVVYLLTSVVFRSALGGLLATTPVLIAATLNFGMMATAGIALDVSNSALAAIGIGIGVDYAIHYLARFRRLTAAGASVDDAAYLTTTTTGRAILFNALVVAAGYLVNLASHFPPTIVLGAIVSFNMVTSFLAAMLVMPALIRLVRPRFLLAPEARETPAHA